MRKQTNTQNPELLKKNQQKQFEQYVKKITPTHNLILQMGKAFLVGGAICLLGQWITHQAISFGSEESVAGSWCSLILIFLSAAFTGMNLYQKLVTWAGAGALVPITGFANSVASCAIEYKAEGQVFGVGSKIFTIAGPVILFGILTSWGLGLFQYLIGLL